jgi:hypothetical protein
MREVVAPHMQVVFRASDMYPEMNLEEHARHMNSLPVSDRLPAQTPGYVVGGFPEITADDALSFVSFWLSQRQSNVQSHESNDVILVVNTLLDLFHRPVVSERNAGDAPVVGYSSSSTGDFSVSLELAESFRIHLPEVTNHWDEAYHGGHMGGLYSILENRRLEAGPRTKRGRRGQDLHGVYCHKHGTRRKCGSYMTYFQFPGFLAAPLYELRVCPNARRTAGDQWCVPADKVQITKLWVHVVKNACVRPGELWAGPEWSQGYEFKPHWMR